MKNKLFALLLVVIMMFSVPMGVFAATPKDVTPSNPVVGNYWSGWMQTASYNSNEKLNQITEALILDVLTDGISGWLTAATAAHTIYVAYKGVTTANIYFTTVKMSRFDNTGLEQYYYIRSAYSNSARTKYLGQIKSETKEQLHTTRVAAEK